MGQKVNPHGLRVGIIKDWDSHWFVDDKDIASNIKEDNEIRKALKKKYYQAAISKIGIEKAATRVIITIYTARPGVLIGKQGAEIEEIKNIARSYANNYCLSINENMFDTNSIDNLVELKQLLISMVEPKKYVK